MEYTAIKNLYGFEDGDCITPGMGVQIAAGYGLHQYYNTTTGNVIQTDFTQHPAVPPGPRRKPEPDGRPRLFPAYRQAVRADQARAQGRTRAHHAARERQYLRGIRRAPVRIDTGANPGTLRRRRCCRLRRHRQVKTSPGFRYIRRRTPSRSPRGSAGTGCVSQAQARGSACAMRACPRAPRPWS